MQAKDPGKTAKPPVDNSNSYIIPILIVGAIVACTRVKAGLIGAEKDVLNIQITSTIGKDQPGATGVKNAISLNIGNPFSAKSRNGFSQLLTGKSEFQGEFLGRKISIAPNNKSKKPPIKEDK